MSITDDGAVEFGRPPLADEPAVGADATNGDRAAVGDEPAGGDVVLPWWRNPAVVVGVVLVLVTIAGLIGFALGDRDMVDDANDVDIGFLQDMRVHHEQAVEMSNIYLALPDTDPLLRLDARGIEFGQSIEIGRMIQMLQVLEAPEIPETDFVMGWMQMPTQLEGMPGLASPAEMDQLANSSGAEADRLFIELMTEHHLGGIHMAEFAQEHAGVERVRDLAAVMARNQQVEIAEMDDFLAQIET